MAVPVEVQGDQVAAILTVGPVFGLDTTTAPFRVAPNNTVLCSNITPNNTYGSYVTALGRSRIGVLPGPCNGFSKFLRPSQEDTYVFALDVGGVGTLYAGPLLGPWVPLSLPESLTPGQNTQFEYSNQWCFVNNGVDVPLKIDSNLVVTFWGIVAPITAPTLSVSGSEDLNGTYVYSITFGNSVQESSQGLISQPITVTEQGIQLTGIPVSTDPQVTERNIYREGGSLGQFFLVTTLNDNTTTTYLDNTSDTTLANNITLTPRRDPPYIFKFIATHQERIFGWGDAENPSVVWFSNLNEPWGFDTVNGFLPVGTNSYADPAAGMSSQGSLLILNKVRSVYAVQGSTSADFIAFKLADTGCRSGLSVSSLDGVTNWINKRGIWTCNGGAPANISDGVYQTSNIKSVIASLSDEDLNNATGFWYDRMYHVSFPTLNATYFFDTRTQGWYKLGWATSQVFTDAESDQTVLGFNLQTVGGFDQWFTGGTDLGQPITASLTSRITDGGTSSTDKIFRYGEIICPPQEGTAYLTCIANPGASQSRDQTSFDLNNSRNGNRHQESWPRAIRGSEVQLELITSSSIQLEIQQVSIYGYVDRNLVQAG